MVTRPEDTKFENDPAVTGNQPFSSAVPDDDDFDDGNITRRKQGGAQRWQFRANQAITAVPNVRLRTKPTRTAKLQEFEHLQGWNRQMTVIGGVQLTNAEAQDARHWLVKHDDDCA